jgi:internalin A
MVTENSITEIENQVNSLIKDIQYLEDRITVNNMNISELQGWLRQGTVTTDVYNRTNQEMETLYDIIGKSRANIDLKQRQISTWNALAEFLRTHSNELSLKQPEIPIDDYFFNLIKTSNISSLLITNITIHDLSPIIGDLSNLTKLDLSNNKLTTLPSEIGKLTNLKVLDLSGNSLTTLPPQIGLLTQLETLIIESCGLTKLPIEIGNLKNLKELVLTANNLIALPSEIGSLVSLEKLDLCFNTEIRELPTEFGKLTNLQELLISDNYFDKSYLDEFLLTITHFSKLKLLEMVNIGITTIPPEIAKLDQLEDLDLHYNQLSDLPNEFAKIISLKNLDICGNYFSKLPECIYELRNLESIYAGENNLEHIDSRISQLKRLRALYIGRQGIGLFFETEKFEPTNQIKELPRSLKELTNLEKLDLTGNPLPIPEEILARSDEPEAIISYYWTLKFLGLGRKSIHEAKVLVVGQGSVGKTSLVQQILHGTFDQNQIKTDGISINQWSVDSGRLSVVSNGQEPSLEDHQRIKLNIWDFGGQEIMHATHQFFLTKRSLYLLVLDARLTQEENRVEYWLKIIQSFGGESPVLIVGNKTDQHPLDIDRTGLKKKYPNIVGILETSAAIGAGIESLKFEIAKQVGSLPHVRDLLPETWFTVKSKLEELGKKKNYFTQDEYIGLCDTNEVTDETSQHTLIGFLHDLGVVLHFQDDPRLEALGILNPQWVTNGVYKILNSNELFQNQGKLTLQLLNNILNLPEYPSNKRLFIVGMMKKFELCYDIEPDKEFLIPDLLPKDEPEGIKLKNVPAFQYHYPVLPSSVITRFVVRMNRYIADNVAWRTGVVLKIGDNKAIVKADVEDRKLSIYIDGPEHKRRDVLSAIRYQLDEIHDTIKGLNPQKRVPIPEAPNAEPLEYDYLLQLERDGFDQHPVKDGNRLVNVNVRKLLSGIESEAKIRESAATITNIYVGGDVSGNLIAGNDNEANANASRRKPKRKS